MAESVAGALGDHAGSGVSSFGRTGADWGTTESGEHCADLQAVAQWIGMPARFIEKVSGHSTRVGATQDLAELDIDLAAITQAGGWKSKRMPLQYAERINSGRSGMARAAKDPGRD